MQFNTPLAISALAHIEQAEQDESVPLRWKQEDWATVIAPPGTTDFYPDDDLPTCGTGMCLGGWGLSLSGIRLLFQSRYIQQTENRAVYSAFYTASGEDIPEAAMRVFGLDQEDLEGTDLWLHDDSLPRLFAYSNTLDDLYAVAAVHAEMDEGELRVAVKDYMTILPPLPNPKPKEV